MILRREVPQRRRAHIGPLVLPLLACAFSVFSLVYTATGVW